MAIEHINPIIKPDSIEEDAVHGSDGPGPDTAKTEITCLFKPEEICERSR